MAVVPLSLGIDIRSVLVDTTGTATGTAGNPLTTTVAAGAAGSAVSATDEGAWTAGSSLFDPIGGVFNDTAAALTAGQQGTIRLTPNRAGHANLRSQNGTELSTATGVITQGAAATGAAVAGNPVWIAAGTTAAGGNAQGLVVESAAQPNLRMAIFNGATEAAVTGANALKVDGSAVTQPVSGTVTANVGTTGGLLLDATFTGRLPATAALADATANPTLTQIQVFPSGINAGGTWDRLKTAPGATGTTGTGLLGAGTCLWDIVGGVNFVKQAGDGSGRAIVVGAAANQVAVVSNPVWIAGSTTAAGGNVQGLVVESAAQPNLRVGIFNGATEVTVTGANALKVDGSAVTQPVSGTVTANVGTTGGLFLDATFTGRLPAAAALSDATANPTLTQIQTFLSVFNGTTWDRTRTIGAATGTTGTGLLGAGVLGFDGTNYVRLSAPATGTAVAATGNPLQVAGSDGTNAQRLSTDTGGRLWARPSSSTGTALLPDTAALADATANPTLTQIQEFSAVFNGTTWDRTRNTVNVVVQASTSTAPGTVNTDITVFNAKTFMCHANVTSYGAAGTFLMKLQWKDANGLFVDIPGATTGTLTTGADIILAVGPTVWPANTATAFYVNWFVPRLIRLVTTVGTNNVTFAQAADLPV